MLFKQISREANFVIDSLADLMKGFPTSSRIFHYAPPLVDDKIRMDRRFLLSNFAPLTLLLTNTSSNSVILYMRDTIPYSIFFSLTCW